MTTKLNHDIQIFLDKYYAKYEDAIEKDEHDGNVLRDYEWMDFAIKAIDLLEKTIGEK